MYVLYYTRWSTNVPWKHNTPDTPNTPDWSCPYIQYCTLYPGGPDIHDVSLNVDDILNRADRMCVHVENAVSVGWYS